MTPSAIPPRRRARRRAGAVLAGLALGALAVQGAVAARAMIAYEPASFERLVASGAPVMAAVHAEWCAVCKAQEPILARLIDTDPRFARVTPVRVDFDTQRDFRRAHNVQKQSTVIIFKGGKETARVSYETDAATITAALAKGL